MFWLLDLIDGMLQGYYACEKTPYSSHSRGIYIRYLTVSSTLALLLRYRWPQAGNIAEKGCR
jgi:hypothetical protein